MSYLFSTLVHDPIYNALIFLYDTVAWQDFGVAIIFTTLLLKFALIPLSKHQIQSQKKLSELQPKIKEIQKKYADDKERQAKEMMKFYKENKVNPLGGCLPLIIQLIFLIAIYRILFVIDESNFAVDAAVLYPFVSNPETVNTIFLGFLDLTARNIPLAIITALAQYWQTKMMLSRSDKEKKPKKNDGQPDFAQIMGKQMLYLGPAITFFIGVQFGAGLMLYWLVSTLFMIAQQWYVMKGASDKRKAVSNKQ